MQITLKPWSTNRYLGVGILVLSFALFYILNSFTQQTQFTLESTCGCAPGTCPMSGNLPVPSYWGYTIILLLSLAGIYLVFAKGEPVMSRKDWSKNFKTLNPDERKLYQIMIDSEGVMFQSELVEKSGYPKVKVSRLLDKMEARGLLERRRRGMANVIILK